MYNNNMEKLNIEIALKLLKCDYILESFFEGEHYYFVYKNNKINILNESYNLNISISNFLLLYKNYEFLLIENKNKEVIDNLKDEEYYSKLQKHQ